MAPKVSAIFIIVIDIISIDMARILLEIRFNWDIAWSRSSGISTLIPITSLIIYPTPSDKFDDRFQQIGPRQHSILFIEMAGQRSDPVQFMKHRGMIGNHRSEGLRGPQVFMLLPFFIMGDDFS